MTSRPTDAEFDELKRARDAEFAALKHARNEEIRAVVAAVCAKHGWDPAEVRVHACPDGPCPPASECYCACPDGPCQHIWDGPDYEAEDWIVSPTCSRCGTVEAYHDLRCAP